MVDVTATTASEEVAPPDWDALITESQAFPPRVVRAHTFVKDWQTASRPALVSCDDGAEWVIKGKQSGKQAVTDQILGTLGRQLNCPIPEVAQVDLPAALISAQPELSHFAPGLAHGSRYQAAYSERLGLDHAAENAEAFAMLAGFYGWGMAQDQQFLYGITHPHAVLSVDHGHFVGGGSWSAESLRQASAAAELDPQIVAHSPPSAAHMLILLDRLRAVSDRDIARAVSLPGLDWEITMEERRGLADLLARRRDSLVTRLEAMRS